MEIIVIYAQLCLAISGAEFKNCDRTQIELEFDSSNVAFADVCAMGKTLMSLSRNIYARPGYHWRIKSSECMSGGDDA